MSAPDTMSGDFGQFARRILFIAALVVLALLVWELRRVLLLAFAAILLAILLRTLAAPVARLTPLGSRGAVAVILVLLIAVLSGSGLVLGTQICQQLSELWRRLPDIVDGVRTFAGETALGRAFADILGRPENLLGGLTVEDALAAATATVSLVADLLFLIVLGVFLAFNPSLYTGGIVSLVPPSHRQRAAEVLAATGQALRSWLLAQFTIMAIVGIATWIGLTLLGVPMALGLAFLAFILEFIPIIGPIVAAVPAILVAFAQSPALGLAVLALYIAIQQVESNVLMPLIQRWVVRVPPALALVGVLVFGLLFGWIGVILATPLVVATLVLVNEVYVKSILKAQAVETAEPDRAKHDSRPA